MLVREIGKIVNAEKIKGPEEANQGGCMGEAEVLPRFGNAALFQEDQPATLEEEGKSENLFGQNCHQKTFSQEGEKEKNETFAEAENN